jgi:hypothetical protein
MTGDEVRAARRILGEMWGLGRPLHAAELARSLRLGGRDPGRTVLDWENHKKEVSGPASVVIDLYLTGSPPPDDMRGIVTER